MVTVTMGKRGKSDCKVHEPDKTAGPQMFGVPGMGTRYSLGILAQSFSSIRAISDVYTLETSKDGELIVHTGLYIKRPDVEQPKPQLALPPAPLSLELPACCMSQPCSGECEDCPTPAY